MALVRRSRPSCDFRPSWTRVGAIPAHEIIYRYIPGILNFSRPRSSGRLEIDLESLFAQAPLLRAGTLEPGLYNRCLNELLSALYKLQFPIPQLRIMEPLMEKARRLYPGDWENLLCTFACYGDLLDSDCLNASPELCDDLSDYILHKLTKIATQAPLSVSLSFVDLLEEDQFQNGMAILVDQVRQRHRDWAKLRASQGQILLRLSNQPSKRIMRYKSL
ncbi:predicted protein [Uncinocarpus reesii 1704]|uniref:Uncharacterized protein n=1 Tax=Uncinocarpus reesii (strain UAMH 1704) TaxID=336963 RepID=C4JX96_UNCRE|nr:uncharacterized protein UREG_06269 [Uncinocarpus reesii 1704]EEP81404.1 predicted protein [Uncinocarpus reesii 1704]